MMLWCELHHTSGMKGGITNFDPSEYEKDLAWLHTVSQVQFFCLIVVSETFLQLMLPLLAGVQGVQDHAASLHTHQTRHKSFQVMCRAFVQQHHWPKVTGPILMISQPRFVAGRACPGTAQ